MAPISSGKTVGIAFNAWTGAKQTLKVDPALLKGVSSLLPGNEAADMMGVLKTELATPVGSIPTVTCS